MNEDMTLKELIEMLQEYLSQNYEFRKNVLSNKFEVRSLDGDTPFIPITKEVLNGISLRVRLSGLEISSHRQILEELIFSDDTTVYDPIRDFLSGLPEWDGQNHIGQLFDRLPGITTEQQYFLSIWLRSAVAHWLGMDTLHANECVATIIGEQGCGKSTFCARLLPPHLRIYYLDHLNLGNKFDKEMALTSNLIVNLDELDQIKRGQHAELKQTLSKSKVNGRPIFGKAQEDRTRYASFVATTNNRHPLSDPTGSRRFLCINIPQGAIIDNTGEIDYGQLYAQVLHELKTKQMRYWFNNEEVARIQQLNAAHQVVNDLGTMIDVCFRHPEKDEKVVALTTSEIICHLRSQFPTVSQGTGTSVKLGLLLKEKEYERQNWGSGRRYLIVARKSA